VEWSWRERGREGLQGKPRKARSSSSERTAAEGKGKSIQTQKEERERRKERRKRRSIKEKRRKLGKFHFSRYRRDIRENGEVSSLTHLFTVLVTKSRSGRSNT
jgi:hypothetical protein